MCRSCRFKKCLENGMLISGVNEPFDSIGTRSFAPKNTEPDKDSQKSSNILQEINNGYRNFLFLRKASSAFNSFETNQNCFTSSYLTSRKQCYIESSLIINFFHPYSNMIETEQKALFEKFYSRFSNLERAFRTYIRFGKTEENQSLIMPDGNFIDINELPKYYENCTKTDPKEVAKIFYPSMAYIVNDIVPFMTRITVDEYEICGLFGILLWQERNLNISKTTSDLMHETREKIFKDLSRYYQSQGKGVDEIATKIGNLLLVNIKVEHSITMVKENREIAELFDMIEFDNCCRE